MKKLKNLIALMLCLMSVGILASCDNSGRYKVSFIEDSMTLEVGQTVNLEDLITLEVAKIQDVTFKSSDSSVVYIKPNNEFETLKNGIAILEAKTGNSLDYLTVTVSSPLEKFTTVNNLSYDNNTGRVSWTNSYKVVSLTTILANSYDVTITHNDISQTINTTNNYYDFTLAGTYKVSVVAKAEGYADSDKSTEIEFTVLTAPQNLVYNKETSTLTWTGVENYEYIVFFDEYSTQVQTTSIVLPFNEAGEHKVKVRAIVGTSLSKMSDEITITRLTSPQVTINEGVLNFDVSQVSLISKYIIKIEDAYGQQSEVENLTGQFSLEGFEANIYYLKVYAIGNGALVLDSLNPQSYEVEKLQSPTLSFDATTKTLSVSGTNTTIEIINKITEETESFDLGQNLSMILDKNNGLYEIYAYYKPQQSNQIKSDNSNYINVKILSSVTQLRHISTDNTSIVSFKGVQGAEGYNILINNISQQYTLEETANLLVCTLETSTNEIFNLAGAYVLSIEAYDTTFESQTENNTEFYLITNNSSNETINITRLGEVTPSEENKIISWTSESLAIGYYYKLYKNDVLIEENTLTQLSLNIENKTFGNYTFEIKALGNSQTVLDALNFSNISFQIKETLQTPSFTFDRTTNELVVGSVDNADAYIISYESSVLSTLTDNLRFYIGDLFDAVGLYEFSVTAVSTTNSADNDGQGNLYSSAETTVTIEKLPVLTGFTVQNEVISFDLAENVLQVLAPQVAEITYNNVSILSLSQIENLNELDNFTISIRLLANTTLTNPYYLNSDFTDFYFERVAVPTSLDYQDEVISWDASVVENYKLLLNVDDVIYEYNLTQNSKDISDFSEETFYQDMLDNGFSFAVMVDISEINATSSETNYMSSKISEYHNVEILQTPQITGVTFDDDLLQNSITVSWNEVANTENYIVTFQGADEVILSTQTNYTFSKQSGVSEYTFKVKAISSDYLSSKQSSLTFEKIASPSTINIDSDENVSVSGYSTQVNTILFNGLAYDGNIYSLSSVTTTDTLEIMFVASGLDNETYYLNSDVTTYSFERLAQVQNINISENEIVWDIEPLADKYEIKLTNASNETKIINITAKTGESNYISSLSLFDDEILSFTENSGDYLVSVRAIVSPYSLDLNNLSGRLSSLDSLQSTFSKLDGVTGLTAYADGTDEQTWVTISFDTVTNATSYDIYLNDIFFETIYTNTTSTDALTYSNEFTNNGSYEIKVVANADNYISSDLSAGYSINRLLAVNASSLTITDYGRFSWVGVSNNNGYKVYYKRTGESASDIYSTTNVYYDFSELLTQDDYAGYIDFYVLVAGDGLTTLSSSYVYSTKVRIETPVFNVYGSYLEITPSLLFPSAQYNVTVKFDDGIEVITINNLVLSTSYIYNFPDVWTYQGNPITADGTYIFEVYAFGTDVIFSPTAQTTREKLQAVSITGFVKDNTEDQTITLKADVTNLSSIDNVSYVLKVDATGYTDTQTVPDASSILNYPLSGDLDYYINSGNFIIYLQATCEGYLDSSKASISGYRLSAVSSLNSTNGILNWALNTHTGVSGYLLRILHSENVYNRLVKSNASTSDSLSGISGNIVANIKVLGNLQTDVAQTSSIILDSTYMLEEIVSGQNYLQEKNFTAFKLETPSSFDMLIGEFKIGIVEQATGYVAKDNLGRTFTLSTAEYGDEYVIGLSDDFYSGVNKLSFDTTYTMSVRAVSSEENVLYSDYTSTTQDIRVMPNPNTSVDDITFTWSTSHVNSIVLTWQSSSISTYYLYNLVAVDTESGYAQTAQYNDAVIGSNSLTLNMDDYSLSGNYAFRIKVLGKLFAESGGYYYIASDYSPAFEFVKLSDPDVNVENGRLTWDAITSANGYYIYYTVKNSDDMVLSSFITLYTEYPYMQNQLYWNAPTSFGSLDDSLTYYFGVRAVNTENSMKFAPSSIGAVYDYVEITQPSENGGEEVIGKENLDTLRSVTKLEAPNELQLINGTLVWKDENLNYNTSIDLTDNSLGIDGGEEPFVYSEDYEELKNLNIIIKLTDINGVERKYTVPAVKFFHATVMDTILGAEIAQIIGLSEDYEFGWPVLNWFTNELGATVVPGLQTLSVSQKGNDYDWLDSNYTSGYDVYIAHAPVTSISNYVLSWNSVALPTDTYAYGATDKYTIVAENESGERSYIYSTNELSVDLRDLVNSGQLVGGRQKLYVMVTGDSSMYLYGLPSTVIEVLVLPTVSASLSGGVLDWATISQAVTYNVILDPNNINYKYENTMTSGPWDFAEIDARNSLGEILTYNLTLQAIGNGTNIISGKVTEMGQIVKLDNPIMSVSQGIFVWSNITNNEGYEMIIRSDSEILLDTYLTKDRIFYESKTNGFNNYNLRAVGTTVGNLNSLSYSYVISSESENGVDAVMLDSITTIRANEGKLLWNNIKEINNTSVAGYKITFDDMNYYDPVFVTNFSPIILDNTAYVTYTIDSSYLAGSYKIYVQAYSTNTYVRSEDGKTYQYLLGGIIENQSSVEFIKLNNVSNISVLDGVLVWDDNEPLSDRFKITFTRASQQVIFYTDTNSFNPATLSDADEILYNSLAVGEQYSVKVQTIGNDLDLINSDEIESSGYSKLSTVSTVEYLIDETGEEGFIIRWLLTDYVSEITDYHYIIKYTNSVSNEEFILDSRTSTAIRRGFLETRDAYYGEIDGSLLMTDSTEQLSFSIAIVPITSVTPVLMLTSDFSAVRSVTPPTSLNGVFTYIESSRKIAWTYDDGGTDVSFRIIDEIVSLDEDNVVTVIETRTYTSQVTEFYPEMIGIHRISISVMLTGEQVASSYVFFKYDTSETGIINDASFVVTNNSVELSYTLINFNLFESGDGSQETPYLISEQTHFENINQRLAKPSYMGGDEQFYFQQTTALNMILSSTIGNFSGIYDGNFKQLTWQYSNTSSTKVGLFISLEPNAIIKNAVINAKIIQQEDLSISTLYLSALVADNYGTIQKSQIKTFTFETSMSRGIDYYYGSFASINYGTILQSVNTANIVFDGSATQTTIRNSQVYVGGVTYINSKTTKSNVIYIGNIMQSGNMGNITIIAKSITVGGVVASNYVDSTVIQTYNKGNIDITLTASATTINYVGGLVAYNQGIIRNSYNVAGLITANLSNYNRTIYIGGLAGYILGSKGAIISNSYTTTTNITVTNEQQANAKIGLMVGYSNASSTTLQTTSYYTSSASIVAINNPPTGFNMAIIGTYPSLLSNLNASDYVFSQGTTYPILTWESDFIAH